MKLTMTVSCEDLTGARLVDAPAGSSVTDVTTWWHGFHFDIEPDERSARFVEATFELTGPAGVVEEVVDVEIVPLSENSPPICDGDSVLQRSDGTGPVEVYINPWCRDPDGDQFVMRGGPPGVHLDSPKTVLAGSSESNWKYRTATFSGTETTEVWATDVLGARSEDAVLTMEVGPSIDRKPHCYPLSWLHTDPIPIYARPGVPRNFGLVCQDEDNDQVTASMTTPPSLGLMTPLDLSAEQHGSTRMVDATYVPFAPTFVPDRFAITASGPEGAGPEVRMQIVPRAPTKNGGGSCGYSPAHAYVGTPQDLRIDCTDYDGDPLVAKVLTPPQHGLAPVALVTPDKYGGSTITVPYTPEPGYEGYDCVVVEITDELGMTFQISIDIEVSGSPPSFEVPTLPPLPIPPLPIGGDRTKKVVQKALGTTAVDRVSRAPGAEVWARNELARDDLVKRGRAPGLVVVCTSTCDVRSKAALRPSSRGSRASRPRTVQQLSGRQAQVVMLSVGHVERRALRAGKSRKGSFRLKLDSGRGKPAAVVATVPVGR
jgi:hypothetical protein